MSPRFLHPKTQKVLVSDRRHNNLLGKNEYGKDVEIHSQNGIDDLKNYIGKFVETKITRASPWNLKGEIA